LRKNTEKKLITKIHERKLKTKTQYRFLTATVWLKRCVQWWWWQGSNQDYA